MNLNHKIAYIDLTTGQINMAAISVEVRNQYVGGRGLGLYLLYNHLKEKVDPLGPDNVVVISAGLLSGMVAPALGWANLAVKSPLNGYLGSASLGEFWAPELRWAGFDHLVIKGKSPAPSYLLIHNDQIEVRNASALWGKTTQETQSILKKELQDEDIQTLCIGPAGEKQVRFAGIVSGSQNTGGRSGIGAVLGSKNLKAVVARGTLDIKIESPREALECYQQIIRQICATKTGQILQQRGANALFTSDSGANHSESLLDRYIDEHSAGMDTCSGCQLHCLRLYTVEQNEETQTCSEGPLSGNPGALETELNSRSIDTILTANRLADSYGLDPLETGSLISWAIQLYERGLLTDEDTGGLKLERGSDEAVLEMINRIGRREGLGNILAEGSLRAAQKIGKDAENYLIQVKGLSRCQTEMLTPAAALALAVGSPEDFTSRPAIDRSGMPEATLRKTYSSPQTYNGPLTANRWDTAGKPWMVFWQELCNMAADMLGICRLNTAYLSPEMPGFAEFSQLIYLNTGWKISAEELWVCAHRACTLERLINLREGYTGNDDRLSDRFLENSAAVEAGPQDIDAGRLKAMLEEYYEIQGWDQDGIPKPQLLKRLGMDADYVIKGEKWNGLTH